MKDPNRRQFLVTSLGLALSGTVASASAEPVPAAALAPAPDGSSSPAMSKTEVPSVDLGDRIHGLILGSLIGDALGGPIEFQDPVAIQLLAQPPKHWRDEETLDETALREAAKRVCLRSYTALRPQPEPYAHWFANAPAGTITDDSRHKFILLHALRHTVAQPERRLGVGQYAQAHLDWPLTALKRNPEHTQLCNEWLEPWRRAARWILGSRDLAQALPPLRMWNGVPTCCGQMSLPPLAAVFAGQPVAAYQAAYQLAFFDNGFGRDMNSLLVAALATALTLPDAPSPGANDVGQQLLWEPVLKTVRSTDPYQYRDIPWMQRSAEYWLDFALQTAQHAEGHPARFFASFDQEFSRTTKWEAQVPFAVAFGVLALARYQPMAAMALSVEWGHDTDSFAQLLGALIGARLGAGAFPVEMRNRVAERLKADAGEDVGEWVQVLTAAARRARENTLLAAD